MRLNVPRLEGWITLTEAAEELKLTREGVHKLCMPTSQRGPELATVRYIGDPSRPVYLVREAEVAALKRRRAQDAAKKADRQAPVVAGPDAGELAAAS